MFLNKIRNFFVYITFVICSFIYANTIDILYNTDAVIGGFQFDVDDVTVLGVSGGDAEANGFTVSSSATTVIGFSLTGSTIPAGTGTLTVLEVEGSAADACLSGLVISDSAGGALEASVVNCTTILIDVIESCDDQAACNFGAAEVCDYPEENFDCDGNCIVDLDCFGVCGGEADFDDCGVCDGPGFSDCWDGSLVCDVANCPDVPTEQIDILYNTDAVIGGFQFDVDGVTVLGASGGDAEANGFTVSSSATTVIGFSLTGSTIPAGTGTLTVLEVEGSAADACLSGLVISDSAGGALEASVVNCTTIYIGNDTVGCTDPDACNYDDSAAIDDGSCDYAQENYDCEGNCVINVDCFGVCGGDAVEDECGVCDGDGILDGACDCDGNVEDCAGNCGGSAVEDECGICGGPGYTICWDGSSVCDVVDCPDVPAGQVNILYDTDVAMAGFQFNVDGVTVLGASGGAADANGFTVSTSATTVIGFSLTGSTIPDGSGSLTVLEIEGSAADACLSGLVVSDSAGGALEASVVNCTTILIDVIETCDDQAACNFGAAEVCDYPEENYDCSGNCVINVDCFGVCGGSAVEDECGICNGPGYTVCWDGSSVCDVADCPDVPIEQVNVLYDTDVAMAGFQFNVDGVTVLGASGGDAEANGFTVSTSATTVIGFSLTGSTIPAGSGTLTVLEVEGSAIDTCLSGLVVSDSEGEELESSVIDCATIFIGTDIVGCMDMNACNYNSDAVFDDGSCEYPEENYDCSGNCVINVDCFGICGGSAVEDECGICDYTTTNDCEQDCNGNWGGTDEFDCDGICGGGNYNCQQDCNGNWNGNAEIDCQGVCDGIGWENECGICGGDLFGNNYELATYADGTSYGCLQTYYEEEVDFINRGSQTYAQCFDICNSTNECTGFEWGTLSNGDYYCVSWMNGACNLSDNPDGLVTHNEYNSANNWWMYDKVEEETCDCEGNFEDCFGVCGGDATEDCTGECGGDIVEDCDGICGGDNYECEQDCNGDWGGDAVVDECGVCDGDGPEENFDCYGNCLVDLDCAGVCGGDAVEDECGVCGGSGGNCAPIISNISDIPDDQGGMVYITFYSSVYDTDSNVTNERYFIERYDNGNWTLDSISEATGQPSYNVLANTIMNNEPTQFRIIASMDEGSWISAVSQGTSIDNIAPPMMTDISIDFYLDNVYLQWTYLEENDIDYYSIYRSLESGFDPTGWDPLGTTTENYYTDIELADGQYFYRLSATDINGNEGNYSDEFSVDILEIMNIPSEFSLKECYPNPFNPTTTISYDIASLSNVQINIYNINGQLVNTLVNQLKEPGSYNVLWDAQHHASGVYFVKLITNDFVDTQKLMLIK